jgi:hypothetical protein
MRTFTMPRPAAMTSGRLMNGLASVTIISLLAYGHVRAQGEYLWSVDELKAKSDLVVVARVTKTGDTGVKATVNSLPVIEVKTDFMFLRRESDGLFVPTSGQLFPDASVFVLHNPGLGIPVLSGEESASAKGHADASAARAGRRFAVVPHERKIG